MQPLGRGRRGSKVAAAVARLQQQARAFEDDEQQFGGHPPSYDGADRIHPAEPWSPERAREFDRRPAGARVAPAPPPVATPRNAVPPEYTLRKAPATPPDSPRIAPTSKRRAFSALVAGVSIALAGGALYTATTAGKKGNQPAVAPTTSPPTTTTAPPTITMLPTPAPTLKPTMARWLRGVVCDAAGVAIPNATVELHYGHFSFDGKLFESKTDEEGLFEFEEVLTGVYYTLVARFDERENFRVTKTPTVADVVIPLPPSQTNGLVALLSWGVAGDDGRVPSSLNLAAVVGDCAGSCPEVTVESSKAAQYASALDAASLLQRHGFASLRIEGAGAVTLAVEMPPDSYGRLEATATLVVDIFVDGATTHQFWRPPNCVAATVASGKNCSAYANASFVDTAAAYAWQGAANRARSKLLRVACGSLSSVAIDGGAPRSLSSLNAAQLYLERPAALTDIHVASCAAAPDYAYRYPAWPATLSADLERRQLDRLWRGMSRGVYLSDGGEAFSTWRERHAWGDDDE